MNTAAMERMETATSAPPAKPAATKKAKRVVIVTPSILEEENYDEGSGDEGNGEPKPSVPVPQEGTQLKSKTGALNDFRIRETRMMEDGSCTGRLKWYGRLLWKMCLRSISFLDSLTTLFVGLAMMDMCLLGGASHIDATLAAVFFGVFVGALLYVFRLFVADITTKQFIDVSPDGVRVATYQTNHEHQLWVLHYCMNVVFSVLALFALQYVNLECPRREACASMKETIAYIEFTHNFTDWHLGNGKSVQDF